MDTVGEFRSGHQPREGPLVELRVREQFAGDGVVDVAGRPAPVASHGVLERWDGRRGPGNLNAYASMSRRLRSVNSQPALPLKDGSGGRVGPG